MSGWRQQKYSEFTGGDMIIIEEERLEKKLRELTDQIGYLLLDLITVSLIKVNSESKNFKEWEEARLNSYTDEPEF